MHVQVTLTRPSCILGPGGRKFSDKAYLELCDANPDLRVERTACGEIVVMPPAGGESSYRSQDVGTQLGLWAKKNGRGKVFDSSSQFFLPDMSALSSDAAWVSNESLKRTSLEERRRFPRLCPEFVVEVRSPSDRLSHAKAKMERWIANGAQLAWLIGADRQTVYIYQPNQPVEMRKGILRLAGKGPVGPHRAAGSVVRRDKPGFVLQLRTIWEGLK